jgi:hypothetical protein
MALRIEEDIVRLDITMDDRLAVEVAETFASLQTGAIGLMRTGKQS